MRIIKVWLITTVIVHAISGIVWVAVGPANRTRFKAWLQSI